MSLNKLDGEIFSEDGTYIYRGIELSPNVFGDVLIYLFNGKQFKRQHALDDVTSFHSEHGGVLEKASYVNAFKKTSQTLKNIMTNIGYGTWKLQYNANSDEIEIINNNDTEVTTTFDVDETIGEGDGKVYVYYYQAYKDRAELKKQTVWECKIGMTDKGVMDRIFSQSGTAFPEYPHVALLIKCASAREMEVALHSVLRIRGRWLHNAPGNEWFLTSPKEIKDLYFALVGQN